MKLMNSMNCVQKNELIFNDIKHTVASTVGQSY